MPRVVWVMLMVLALQIAVPVQAAPLSQADTPVEDRVATIEEGAPDWQDDFETDIVPDFWTESASDVSERFFEEGAYQIAVYEPKTVAWEMAGDLAYEDVLVAVDVQAVAGPVDNQMGIIFRHLDDDNFYIYRISSDGYYSLTRLVDGEWDSLIDWSTTEAIDQTEGAWNHLELLVESGVINLLVNGERIDTFEDEDSYVGGIGLIAGAYDEADVQIAFDDFTVWDVQPQSKDLAARLDEIRAA